jgi:ribose-phosphate pyrophosphokinase
MELIFAVTAARRAGAGRVTAVIPYFGYKYHKRGLPISASYQSRFLWSAAGDFAKMLQTVGVDSIVSVDLQRPGQGHEASICDNTIPTETWSSNDVLVDYVVTNLEFDRKVVVVAANSDCAKKARRFQMSLQKRLGVAVDFGAFVRADPVSISQRIATSEFLGDVKDADVIIIDDIVGRYCMYH